MLSRNPILNRTSFYTAPAERKKAFSVSGAINKSLLLLTVTTFIAFGVWFYGKSIDFRYPKYFFAVSGSLAFITAVIIRYKREWARSLSFVYAFFKGVFLGAISSVYIVRYNGIVFQAVLLTCLVFIIMLLLYRFRIIKVTQKLRAIIMAATTAILTLYLISFILYIFNMPPIPYIHSNGLIGIIFSIFVSVTASFHLLLDFNFFERCSRYRYPNYIEWYAAFGLLVSILWQYLSFLRLLKKLRA